MLVVPQGERFFGSTRGQVLALLRGGDRTADELARALNLTGSAVRMHLAALERDGLVRRGSPRRGAGKPAYPYQLTAQAERLFPRAHERVLEQLFRVLKARLSPAALDAVIREVAQRLAGEAPVPHRRLSGVTGGVGGQEDRLERAVALFGALGALPVVERLDGAVRVSSHTCPLAGIEDPGVCGVMQALLAEVVGAPVHTMCDRIDRPHCAFQLDPPAAA